MKLQDVDGNLEQLTKNAHIADRTRKMVPTTGRASSFLVLFEFSRPK